DSSSSRYLAQYLCVWFHSHPMIPRSGGFFSPSGGAKTPLRRAGRAGAMVASAVLVGDGVLEVGAQVETVLFELALGAALDTHVIAAGVDALNAEALPGGEDGLRAELVRTPLFVRAGRDVQVADIDAAVVDDRERNMLV